MTKCTACPVAALSVPCHAHTTGHRRFCELAGTRCDYRRLIYAQSTGEPAPFDCPADEPSTPPVSAPPQPPPVVVHPQTPTVPLAVSLAVVRCPSRGAPIECGCAAERRYCGETLDVMVWGGCVACKAAETSGDASPA